MVATEKNGWIKLHRKMQDNPIIMKDAAHLAVWMYLLLNATHAEYPALFKGKKIMLQPGQLITGRKAIGSALSVDESKVTRILNSFEIEHQIEQQTSNKNRLISIVNWDLYQSTEQQNELQVNNNRTTDEQQVNTNKNEKNNKNGENGKKGVRETTHTIFEKLLPEYPFSEMLISKMREWVTYKAERKESYKEQGMRSLLTQVGKHSVKHGDQAVCELIDYCMASNWKGIIFDRLQDKKQGVRKEPVPSWMEKKSSAEKYVGNYIQRDYSDEELLELERACLGVKTAGSDPEIAARAEALKEQFQGKE